MTYKDMVRRVASEAGLLFLAVGIHAQAQTMPAAPTDFRVDGKSVPASTPTGGGSAPTSTLGAGWTLDATKVGLAPLGLVCAQLPVYVGPNEVPAGTVISGRRFTGNVSLYQGNITIEKSCFQPTNAGRGLPIASTTNNNGNSESGKGKVIIRDSEFDGSLLTREIAAYASGFHGIADLQRNYIHHFGSGIALYNAGSQMDALIEHNYVTNLLAFGDGATTGNHSDGFTIRDFTLSANPNRQAIIRNNRINTDSANTTGSFFIQDTWNSGIGNIVVTGNLLEGLGYEMGLEKRNAPITNVRITNNRFRGTADGGFGACYRSGGFVWAEWADNFLYSPSSANSAGSAVTC